MTKRRSEGEFGAALRDVDLNVYVYRPPDPKGPEGISNWKPCDFMLWRHFPEPDAPTESHWFEVKDVDAVEAFALAELRPSQLQGIHDAARLGIPYWLAVYWRRHRTWTISDAAKLLAWRDDREVVPDRVQEAVDFLRLHGPAAKLPDAMLLPPATSVARSLLSSRFGVDSTPKQLSSTLKAVLLGEV